MEVKYPTYRKRRTPRLRIGVAIDWAEARELTGLLMDQANGDEVSEALAKAAREFPKS